MRQAGLVALAAAAQRQTVVLCWVGFVGFNVVVAGCELVEQVVGRANSRDYLSGNAALV